MKRVIALFLAALLQIAAATGCTQLENSKTANTQPQNTLHKSTQPQSTQSGSTAAADRLHIICTVFPQYDWVRQILGDKAEDFDITLLLDKRIDLHNYQPSVDDIVKISTSDLFIYVGGPSDGWVENVLRQAINPNMVVISLLNILGDGVKIEEIIEGMEHDDEGHGDDGDGHGDDDGHGVGDDDDDDGHGEGDDHDNGHEGEGDDHDNRHEGEGEGDDHDYGHEGEHDEHVWMSLQHAQTFCAVIADALSTLDAGNATVYYSNMIDYVQKLSDLDAEYQTVANDANVKTLLFGDRFPFRYLLDDYGISYYAAFPGCSAETEASFDTIVFLSGKMDEMDLRNIMVTESADQSIARTIVSNTKEKNQQIHVLNAMQAVTANDIRSGASYLAIMESNLNVLKQALA